MFYEDFSNPKFVSDTCKWVFPYLENFYLDDSEVFYESRMIPLDIPIVGKDELDLLLVIPACKDDLTSGSKATSKVTIHLEGKDSNEQFLDVFRIEPLLVGSGPFDYYRMKGQISIIDEPLINYKVKIKKLSLNSIKICGL